MALTLAQQLNIYGNKSYTSRKILKRICDDHRSVHAANTCKDYILDNNTWSHGEFSNNLFWRKIYVMYYCFKVLFYAFPSQNALRRSIKSTTFFFFALLAESSRILKKSFYLWYELVWLNYWTRGLICIRSCDVYGFMLWLSYFAFWKNVFGNSLKFEYLTVSELFFLVDSSCHWTCDKLCNWIMLALPQHTVKIHSSFH